MITLSSFLEVLHTDYLLFYLFIYLLVGLNGLFFLFLIKKNCHICLCLDSILQIHFIKNHLSFIVSPTTPIEKDMSQRLNKGTLCHI